MKFAALFLVLALAGCAEKPLRPGEHREYYAKPAPACQVARDRNDRMIPGTYVCNPRRAPVVGSRIVRHSKPTPTEK